MRQLPLVNALPGATTAPGAFRIDNPELRAGAFDYVCFRAASTEAPPRQRAVASSRSRD